MPFVRISLLESFSQEKKYTISKAVHESLIEAFNVPEDDYFHVIEELKPEQIIFPKSYLEIEHTRDMIYIQIIAATGRTVEQKKNLYAAIAKKISASTKISINDILIVLLENNGKENWSFGQGEIQELKHIK